MSDYKLDSASKEEWMERAMKAEDKLNTQLFKELSKPKMTKLEELKAEKDAAHVAYDIAGAASYAVWVDAATAYRIELKTVWVDAAYAYRKELRKQEKETKDD